MVHLTVEALTRSYGEKVLFENIAFGINKGDKCGLIAPNGSGKTTLLRTLAGEEEPDEGSLTWNKETRTAYLSQDPYLHADDTILEALFRHSGPAGQALRDYYKIQQEGADVNESYQQSLENMDNAKAWELDVLARKVLSFLEVPEISRKCSELSGGQRKRVALAGVLLLQPDFLLLDEPTNHLDLPMTEWLEDYLTSRGITLLMVTHDRYFLERVCNRIFELENKQLFIYEGNYQYYLQKRAERKQAEAAHTERAEKLLKKELQWLSRQPKARGTKAKARISRADELSDKVNQSSEDEQDLELGMHMVRLGNKVMELKNVSKAFNDETVISRLSYSFKRAEKLGVTGKNGTGKSTFLKLLAGDMPPDSGKIIRGETLRTGYYRQEGMQLNEDKRVIDVVRDIAETIDIGNKHMLSPEQFLEKFMFSRKQQQQKVSTLSGGEKKRLYLVTVLAPGPNFLMLDEPTNDLDLLTINRLEQFLMGFQGCAIVVTHDRYFLDKMADHLFVFLPDGQIKDFPGNYSQYRDSVHEAEKSTAKQQNESGKDKRNKPAVKKQGKLSYKEKRELESLDKEIAELEKEKHEIEENLNAGNFEGKELADKSSRLSFLLDQIEEKTMRWLELEDKHS